MITRTLLAALLLCACAVAPAEAPRAPQAQLASDAEIEAAASAPVPESDRAYIAPMQPFNIIGNIYYVGSPDMYEGAPGVSAFLITTPEGHFLIDGGPAQAAPIVEARIAQLGFSIRDVKYLLNSHAHYDHAGALAQLHHDSGAILAAGAEDAEILAAGQISYGPSEGMRFPPVRVTRPVHDGDTITLGGVTLTAHATHGHTPGCTSWSVQVTDSNGRPHVAFIHCSATVAGQSLAPPSYPSMIEDYRATFARVRGIEADVFLGSHGAFFDLEEKRARQLAGEANAFVDPGGLQRFNSALARAFEAELARQEGARQ
jgi:metallo-beta-lactamase class B